MKTEIQTLTYIYKPYWWYFVVQKSEEMIWLKLVLEINKLTG